MRAFKITFFIFLLFYTATMTGQEKELKEAIKRGKRIDFFYIANPTDLTNDKFLKWEKKQKDYIIKSSKAEQRYKYGLLTDYVIEIRFLPKSEEEAYHKYLAQKAQERANEETLKTVVSIGGLIGAGVVAGVAVASSGRSSSRSSGNVTSSRTNENNSSNTSLPPKNATSNIKIDPETVFIPAEYQVSEKEFPYKWRDKKDDNNDAILWVDAIDYKFKTIRWHWKQDELKNYTEGEIRIDKNGYHISVAPGGVIEKFYYNSEEDCRNAIYVYKRHQAIRKTGQKK